VNETAELARGVGGAGADPGNYLRSGSSAIRAVQQSAAGAVEQVHHSNVSEEGPLAGIAQELTSRMAAIEADCEALASLLDRVGNTFAAQAELAAVPDPVPAADADGDLAAMPADPGSRASGRIGDAEHADADPDDGVRLLATQLMIAGHDRDEVRRRLRSEFGIECSERMLAAVFEDAGRDAA
jgi:hypothetical protein